MENTRQLMGAMQQWYWNSHILYCLWRAAKSWYDCRR